MAEGGTHDIFVGEGVIVVKAGVCAGKGEPAGKTIACSVAGGQIVIVVIGGMKRHGSAHGLKLETVAAGGAGVDHLDVVKGENVVPKPEMSLNSAVFNHSRAVGLGGVNLIPNAQRPAVVEVLTVN